MYTIARYSSSWYIQSFSLHLDCLALPECPHGAMFLCRATNALPPICMVLLHASRLPSETITGVCGAGFDPGVILMRNTPEVRSFWRAVQETLQDAALMAKVCSEKFRALPRTCLSTCLSDFAAACCWALPGASICQRVRRLSLLTDATLFAELNLDEALR